MPVKCACPQCKTPYLVPDHQLNKALRCTKCQQTFRTAAPAPPPEIILDAEIVAPAPTAPPADGIARQPARPVRSPAAMRAPTPSGKSAGRGKVLAIALAVGFAVLLLLGGLTLGAGYMAYTMLLRPVPQVAAALTNEAANLNGDPEQLNAGAGQPPSKQPAESPPTPENPGKHDRQPTAPPLMPPPDKGPVSPDNGDKGPGPNPSDPPFNAASVLKPSPLQADREERTVPSTIDDVCVGGGGRYLILRLPRERKLAVFDANEAKIVKYLPLTEDGAVFAAGQDKLIIGLPTSNVLQRWSLTTFEKEATVQSPTQGALADLVMGAASRGPLLVCTAGGEPFARGRSGMFVDPTTFKPLDLKWSDGQMPGTAPGLVRASADGTLFGMRPGTGGEPHDMSLVSLNGNQARTRTAWLGASLLEPGPDGRYVYSADGVCSSQLDKLYPKTGETVPFHTFVPAREGDFFLRLEPKSTNGLPPGFPGREGEPAVGAISLLLPGQYRPIAVLRDIEGVSGENLSYGGNGKDRMHYDKRIHLIPDAKLLVTIPSTNDRLILRRFDLDALLAKSDVDYLFVASQPPASVERGGQLAYPVVVKSKKGGVTRKLDSGPKGMTLTADGVLRWDAPADFADPDADVLVTVGDASGQEVFQTFKLSIADKGAASAKTPVAVKPAPDDKPVEVKTPSAPSTAEDGLKPAPLKEDREVRALPSAIDDVCVGGGGRYLILRLPRERKLAVFDANEAKIVKYLPLTEDNVKTAAGQDKLIVALPTSNVLQRWSLPALEKEVAVTNPVPGTVTRLLLGSATEGPLVIGAAGGGRGPAFLDPMTFKEADYSVVNGGGFGGLLDFGNAGSQTRISANGDVITGWSLGSSPSGLTTLVRQGKTFKQYYEHISVGAILPSADGQTLFTSAGLYTPEAKQVRKTNGGFNHGVWTVPSVEGLYHLTFTQLGDATKADGQVFSVAVHLAGDAAPLAALPGSKDFDGLVNWQTGQAQALDQHVFLIPDAGLLVVIPASNDKLILQRFDLDSLLEKAGVDYLFVASRPVTRAVKGTKYTYPLVVKSKKGGVTINLDSGPPGMEVGADGKITWKPPADFADPDTDVLLRVKDASGQEVLHSFRVTVSGAKEAAP